MTQLTKSVQWSRERRANKVARLREIIIEELEKKRQFQEDCHHIYIQCKGNRSLYYKMVKARKLYLEKHK